MSHENSAQGAYMGQSQAMGPDHPGKKRLAEIAAYTRMMDDRRNPALRADLGDASAYGSARGMYLGGGKFENDTSPSLLASQPPPTASPSPSVGYSAPEVPSYAIRQPTELSSPGGGGVMVKPEETKYAIRTPQTISGTGGEETPMINSGNMANTGYQELTGGYNPFGGYQARNSYNPFGYGGGYGQGFYSPYGVSFGGPSYGGYGRATFGGYGGSPFGMMGGGYGWR